MDLHNLNSTELRRFVSGRCHHRHTYLEHPQCFRELEEEHVGFLDIECANLKPDWGGFIICYVLSDGTTTYHDRIKSEDIKKWGKEGKEDTRVLGNLIQDLYRFDRVIGHYSSRFDLKHIRTRAVICGVEFPSYGALYQTDTWNILRAKFNLSRNSLENATKRLTGATQKTHLTGNHINEAIRGNKWAIDWFYEHCVLDVEDTIKLYNTISPFAKLTKSLI